MKNRLAIGLDQVNQQFRIIHDRPDSFREAFVRQFRSLGRYEDLHALRDISLRIGRGESVGIIGRNGSGKSTLLKIIARVYKPTSGRVELEGRISALIELGAGFHHELTGRENIVVNGALLGFSRRQMKGKYRDIVAFAELEEFIDTPIKQYSTGMLARLAFAIATEVDPDILLVDEILAVGDQLFQQKCLERMNNFRRKGKTTVFVSHDMGLVQSLCERILLLDHGRLRADGPAEGVIARYHELLEQSASAPSSPDYA
ncbi:MAG: ABC transporter ATP-binding protein [Lysobacterales bacterium]